MKLLKLIIKVILLILIILINISCIATTKLIGEKQGEFQHEFIGKEYEIISDDGEWLSYVNLKFVEEGNEIIVIMKRHTYYYFSQTIILDIWVIKETSENQILCRPVLQERAVRYHKYNVHYSEWGNWKDSDLTPFENMVIDHPPDAATSDLFIFSDDGTTVNWINNYWMLNINLYEIPDINFELIEIEDLPEDYFLRFWIKSKQEWIK